MNGHAKMKNESLIEIPLCSIKRKINRRHLLSVFASSGGESRVQSQTSTRNKDPESHCSLIQSCLPTWGNSETNFWLLGLKHLYILTPVNRPDYSSDPQR